MAAIAHPHRLHAAVRTAGRRDAADAGAAAHVAAAVDGHAAAGRLALEDGGPVHQPQLDDQVTRR
ncbi:MAG: hypothetical protein J0L57_10085, partial [Burkholderiales bacterium]|nr:hypothetical protein [Burkholderiales bacterium]